MRFHLEELVQDEINLYVSKCNFTKDELNVFMMKVKGISIVSIGIQLGMSEKSVCNITKRIVKKMNKVRNVE